MLYLTAYMDSRGDVQAHHSPDPLGFVRDAPPRLDVLYRAVIDGVVVEFDTNDEPQR